jgi:hypothetical protein
LIPLPAGSRGRDLRYDHKEDDIVSKELPILWANTLGINEGVW